MIAAIDQAIADEEYIFAPGSKMDEIRNYILDEERRENTEFIMGFISHIPAPKRTIFSQPDDIQNEFIL